MCPFFLENGKNVPFFLLGDAALLSKIWSDESKKPFGYFNASLWYFLVSSLAIFSDLPTS